MVFFFVNIYDVFFYKLELISILFLQCSSWNKEPAELAVDFKSTRAIINIFSSWNFDKAISKCFERPIMWITTAYDVVKRSIPPIKSVRIKKICLYHEEKKINLLFFIAFISKITVMILKVNFFLHFNILVNSYKISLVQFTWPS